MEESSEEINALAAALAKDEAEREADFQATKEKVWEMSEDPSESSPKFIAYQLGLTEASVREILAGKPIILIDDGKAPEPPIEVHDDQMTWDDLRLLMYGMPPGSLIQICEEGVDRPVVDWCIERTATSARLVLGRAQFY